MRQIPLEGQPFGTSEVPPDRAKACVSNTCERRKRTRLLSFLSAESAAVTVDFVVLTATALTIGLSMATIIGDGAMTESDDINKCLRRSGNQLSKDISYDQQLERMRKRCAKL
jgi:hypothetical protein